MTPPMNDGQRDDRMWEMLQTLAEVKATVGAIKERVDKMPCIAHGEMIAEIKAQAKLWGGIIGLVVAAAFELITTFWRK